MTENNNFETLGDAYAKYPQSTLVMRKQYVDEKDARIAQLEDDNALLKSNNENLRIDKKEIETELVIDPTVKVYMTKIDAIKEGFLKDYHPIELRDPKIASMVKKTIAEAIAPYQKELADYLSTRETTPYRFVCNIDQLVKIDEE